MEKTKGFVIKTLKYGDTSAILKVFTEEFGTISFLLKGFFNPKKKTLRSLQFPFAMAEFSFKRNKKSDLILASQITQTHEFTSLFQHPVKMLMVQFLAEITHLVLKEESENKNLFDFIENSLILFNHKETHFADFHLFFLTRLTLFLGFYPNLNHIEYPYFDLQEGTFIPDKNATFLLNQNETEIWKRMVQFEFDLESENQFSQNERTLLTNLLLDYYKLHIPGFREPNSLEIIKEVFNS